MKEMTASDTVGYYRVKLTHAQAAEIHRRGIDITAARPTPGPGPKPRIN